MKTENYLKELVFIFFRQKRVIVWMTGLTFLLALLVALFWPPTYAANGNILVRGKKLEKSPQAIESEDNRTPEVSRETLASEEKILVSPNVIEQTLKDLMAKNLIPKISNRELVKEVYRVQDKLKTELVPASNVIEVSYYDRNLDKALILLAAIMDNYIIYRNTVYNPIEAEGFFTGNAERYRDKLTAKEKELLSLVRERSISDPKTELTNNLIVKQTLQLQLNQLKNDVIDYTGLINHLNELLAPTAGNKKTPATGEATSTHREMPLFSFIENVPAIVKLNEKIQELLIERGNAMRGYNEESTKVKLLTQHLDDAYGKLQGEVRNYRDNEQVKLNGVLKKIESLQQRTHDIDQENIHLKEQIIAQEGLERDIGVFSSSFEVFAKRREEAMAALEDNVPSHVSIVKKAFPSDGPVFPKRNLLLLLGLLAGFINGFILGFLIEYFDHTFKKPSDVERYTGMQVIASIPHR